MLGQTFSLLDVPRVAVLAFLEILLSADNAVVLGLIVSRLAPHLRSRALYIGFISAWIFRLAGILGIAFLLAYPWIQLVGSIYLFYLTIHHFLKKKSKDQLIPPIANFWKTVFMIELMDLAFAIDSIVAGVAFIGASVQGFTFHPKIWIVYAGGMIGVFAIRYAAHLFSSIIHLFPRLETAAYAMIAWIGIRLSFQSFSLTFPYHELVFWAVLAILFLLGLTKRRSHV